MDVDGFGMDSCPSTLTAHSKIDFQDSVMSGNVNISQSSTRATSTIYIKDSGLSGDINIIQNRKEALFLLR